MAQDVRVQCINKHPTHSDPHRRITHIGGINPNGTRWRMTEDEAIAYIKNGTYTFYTYENNKRANVIIAVHEGREYLKTTADGVRPDNLLALPECPK